MRHWNLRLAVCLAAAATATAHAESISECQEYLRTGQYTECLRAASEAIAARSYGEEWPILRATSELVTGRYPDAVTTLAAGMERYSWSVRILMLQYECAQATGNGELARQSLAEIERLVQTASWRYTDADDLVALGHAALALGADPRDVQEGFFDRARRNFANRPDGFLAGGRLAAEKGDFQLAAEILEPAAKAFPDDPEILLQLSMALEGSDSERASQLLKQVLAINPRHPEALQQVVQRQIDSEDYAAATKTIDHMLSTNVHDPVAHGLQAVVSHLLGDPDSAAQSVDEAMKFSGPSAAVSHLIGERLSRKYRFREGAEFQRAALAADPNFHPAKIQLAQDLLRLGEDEEGWRLAAEAHQADGYNTTVFNLLQLRDSLDRFATLESDHFLVRLEKREAAVYGARAVELLEEAYAVLSERYGYAPRDRVVVEIYPRVDDFAVRTFGIPDVSGFLGVCFGKVITANSPATRRENPSNWESVLWHEFCHVITLQMTGNRIPRWLSEGISVYEERRRDPRWGQQMDFESRDRILEGEVTPVSQLSSAFLSAESGDDLNFAYYESSMVVEFLVESFGLASLTRVLSDLESGLNINDALERQTVDIETLNQTFAEWLRVRAERWAPEATFDAEPLAMISNAGIEVQEFVAQNPGNIPAGLLLASRLIQDERLQDAEELLLRLTELAPELSGANGPRPLLATVYGRLDRTEDEYRVLEEHTRHNADDLAAFTRMQEIAEAAARPADIIAAGHAIQAIDPFQIPPVLRLAQAAEESGEMQVAAAALDRLIVLVPDNAARFHFRIAQLLAASDTAASRRHVLLSLEQAPRYRDAHQLLLKLKAASDEAPAVEPGAVQPATPGDPDAVSGSREAEALRRP